MYKSNVQRKDLMNEMTKRWHDFQVRDMVGQVQIFPTATNKIHDIHHDHYPCKLDRIERSTAYLLQFHPTIDVVRDRIDTILILLEILLCCDEATSTAVDCWTHCR